MSDHRAAAFSSSLNWGSMQITSLYLVFGCLWILSSDRIAAGVAASKEMPAAISMYKGWGHPHLHAIPVAIVTSSAEDPDVQAVTSWARTLRDQACTV